MHLGVAVELRGLETAACGRDDDFKYDGGTAMSVRTLTAKLIGSLVILCGITSVQAQESPFADPLDFDPDFRWFEPIYDIDIAETHPRRRPNNGWFASYDRTYMYGSRPELEVPQSDNEFIFDDGWGHRWEMGFMLPEEHTGWLFSYVQQKIAGANVTRHTRGNVFNEDELGGEATNPAPPFGWEAVPGISNNIGYSYRFFDETDMLNNIQLDSYELMKTWRMAPLRKGGIIEPWLGFRWMRVRDINSDQDWDSSNLASDWTGVGVGDGDSFIETQYGSGGEIVTTRQAITNNEGLLAQFGGRYYTYRNRFKFSSDLRCFCGLNLQDSISQTTQAITLYGAAPIAEGDEVSGLLSTTTTPISVRNDEFMFGYDVRGEVGYQLTKAIFVRGGVQVIDMWGVWRGGDTANAPVNGGYTNQDLFLFGGTFGLELNR